MKFMKIERVAILVCVVAILLIVFNDITTEEIDIGSKIELYPNYVPKDGTPFLVKVNFSGSVNTSYDIRAGIGIKNESGEWKYPSYYWSWEHMDWRYSGYGSLYFKTNESGRWKGNVYIKINTDSKNYDLIKNASNASLCIDCRKHDGSYIGWIDKKIGLLDMDNSTKNGTKGGWVKGNLNISDNQEKIVILENENGSIVGTYITENNSINEGYPPKPGFYKLSGPIGENYTLRFFEKDEKIYNISDIKIMRGSYGISIFCEDSYHEVKIGECTSYLITIENTGDFEDTIDIELKIPENWDAWISEDEFFFIKEKCII